MPCWLYGDDPCWRLPYAYNQYSIVFWCLRFDTAPILKPSRSDPTIHWLEQLDLLVRFACSLWSMNATTVVVLFHTTDVVRRREQNNFCFLAILSAGAFSLLLFFLDQGQPPHIDFNVDLDTLSPFHLTISAISNCFDTARFPAKGANFRGNGGGVNTSERRSRRRQRWSRGGNQP